MIKRHYEILIMLIAEFILAAQMTATPVQRGSASEFCDSAACQDLAAQFASSMNTGHSACQDFYEYACSNRTSEQDALKQMDAELNAQITSKWVLPHTVKNYTRKWQMDLFLEYLSMAFDVELLQEPKRVEEPSSVHKAKDMFSACMNEKDRKKLGNVELQRIIENEYGGWPILNRTELDAAGQGQGQQSWELLAGKLRRLGYSLLLRINVNIDQRNQTRHIIELDRGRAEYVPQLPNSLLNYLGYVAAQSNFIHGSAMLLGAEAGEPIKKDIAEMLRFQMRLNQLINDKETDKAHNYNVMQISDLNKLSSDHLDWLTLLNATFQSVKSIDADEEVVVLDIEYVKRLGDLINRTDKRVLKNYLIWRVVKDVAEDGDPDMTALNPERLSGLRSKLDICLKEVKGFLGFVVTHMYVRRNDRRREIALARTIVDTVKSAFRSLIRANNWMDKSTKNQAQAKLDKLSPKIGFPEWILDANKLDAYYQQAEVNGENHFSNIMNLSSMYSLQELELLNTVPDRTSWVTSPLMVNAFYHRTMNEIYIPFAILRRPFVDPEWPMSSAFGGIGAVIGHEITHGFDDESFIVAANGSLIHWWTSSTTPRYEKATKCVTDQYDQYCPDDDLTRNREKLCVDGRNTLRENVADIGGVKSSFMAYQLWKLNANNDSAVNFNLKDFTDNQMFFLNFAQIWCTSTPPNAFLKQSPNSINSPNKYRLLGSLKNLDIFKEIFECSTPAGRPNDKCAVW